MSKETKTKTETEKLPEDALDKVTGGAAGQVMLEESLVDINPKLKNLNLNNPPIKP